MTYKFLEQIAGRINGLRGHFEKEVAFQSVNLIPTTLFILLFI